MKKLLIILMLIIASVFVFNGCQKNDDASINNETAPPLCTIHYKRK